MSQTLFHLIFIATFGAFIVIRLVYHRKAYQTAGKVEYKEGRLNQLLRALFGSTYILLMLVYMVYPPSLGWADFPLPAWAQWIGALFAIAVVPLIAWVQWALGSNFNTTLHVRETHTLVTHGPYRWVRHPMYSVMYLQAIGLLLLTHNAFIGGVYLAVLTGVMITRTRNEESAMLEKFGDSYRRYMLHTGQFLPKVF